MQMKMGPIAHAGTVKSMEVFAETTSSGGSNESKKINFSLRNYTARIALRNKMLFEMQLTANAYFHLGKSVALDNYYVGSYPPITLHTDKSTFKESENRLAAFVRQVRSLAHQAHFDGAHLA